MQEQDELRAEYQAIVKGQNFMTPYHVEYGATDRHLWEITEARQKLSSGFGSGMNYGLTVICRDTKLRDDEHSNCFGTLREVYKAIKEIKEFDKALPEARKAG